jgi:EmrB/QacA subfamily drug resistance transporter
VTKEELKILCVVCLGAFLFFNSIGSINVAVPTIQREFGASLATIQWVAIMGVVMISSLSLCFGRAGDILGRRKLYRVGVALYALGSGLSALSQSVVQLLIFRALMTVGLAMAVPLSAAILASNFAPERRGQALGWYASAIGIGRATGPTFAGFLLYLYGWRAIFLMNLVIGFFVSAAVFRVLKGEEERRPESFDFVGTLALLIGYPSLLIALSLGAHTRWTSPQIPVWFVLAAAGILGFVWVELRTRKPLINPSFFRSLPLSAAILSLVIISVVHNPIGIFAPLYMENVLGFSSVFVGLIMTSLPVFIALSSPLSGRLADRLEARYVATFGLASILAGIALYARLGATTPYLWVVASLALIGTGIGFFTPANQRAAFATVGQEHYGILSAMLASFGTASGTVGVTVAVALIEGMMAGTRFDDPAAFASAQQFVFLALLPLAGAAIAVSLAGGSGRNLEPR